MLLAAFTVALSLVHFQSPSGNINCIGAPRRLRPARVRRVPRPQAHVAGEHHAAQAGELRPRLRPLHGLARATGRSSVGSCRGDIGPLCVYTSDKCSTLGVRPVGEDRPDPLHVGHGRGDLPVHHEPARRLHDRPRGLRHLPLVKWGIISTADINRLVIPPAQASPKVDLVGGREPHAGARRRVRREVGHPARVRLVRGAARRPGDRGGLHLAAEHDAHRVVGQVGRGREARPLREAVHAAPGGGHRGAGTPPTAPGSSSRRRSCTGTTRSRSGCARSSRRARSASCA